MKKLLIAFSLIFILALVGCSSKNEVKYVPVEDIKNAINTETLLKVQPIEELPASDYYVFESVKNNIKEGFVLKASMNVKLQDVFVVKTDDVEKVKSAIQDYKDNDMSFKMFGDGYGGDDNITAVADSILASKGDYVYFIAAPNAKDIETKILEVLE